MIVDRVARAMTEGAPRAGFTARVMAPIHGQPQPGFTARVMDGLDAPRPQTRGLTLGHALIAAGAVAIAAVAVLQRPADVVMPPVPDTPRIAARPYDRELIGIPPLPYDRWAPKASAVRTRRAQGPAPRDVAPTVQVLSQAPPVHTIAPLHAVAEIPLKPIGPPAFSVPALSAPAPLSIIELPAATGRFPQLEPKEMP